MSVDVVTLPDGADDLLDRIGELTDRFRRRLPLTESQRSVPRESIDELVEAGLARAMVPPERGGLGLGIRDVVDVTIAVSYGCASTGWLAFLMMHVPHVIAMFPQEAQDAVWAHGPDVVTAGSHLGISVTAVPGGYRITGKGPFTSGVNNAEWVYVGGMVPAASGPGELRYFLLHRSQYTVADTWDTAGMRGTGSNTVVTDDLFVPEAFTLAHVDAREGTGPGAAGSSDSLLHQPWVTKGSLGFVATTLGAAQAAFDDVTRSLAGKRSPGGARVADGQALQIDVGLASARLDAAHNLLRAIGDRSDAGGVFSLAERARISRDTALIVSLAIEAVDAVLAMSGTSGFGSSAVAQQSWRDIHFAAAHVSLSRREPLARYGRIVLGIPEAAPGLFF